MGVSLNDKYHLISLFDCTGNTLIEYLFSILYAQANVQDMDPSRAVESFLYATRMTLKLA
ncbi:MAG: hypothetical protein ACI9UT_003504 [Flavobacteriales bacterium]|jgi:hypothetical protein